MEGRVRERSEVKEEYRKGREGKEKEGRESEVKGEYR